jgi:AcrR family transcriptional regulator
LSAGSPTVATKPARGPGRPPSDAPERIVEAAYQVLKRDGYAGLTTAKVATASGQNKALISYYFGSKQGLVDAVARRVSKALTDEILGGVGEPADGEQLVGRLAERLFAAMDRDDGLQRVYFDLSSQAVVEPRVGATLLEMKQGHQAIVRELLRDLPTGPAGEDELDGLAVFLIAGLEGLALERISRGDSAALRRARELFVEAASTLLR